jgi:hypothetical protein
MDSDFNSMVGMLLAELPMLIVYVVGFFVAYRHRAQMPQAARRTMFAVFLFLLDLTIFSSVTFWVLETVVAQGGEGAEIEFVLNVVALLRSLVRAWAFMLLLGAIFPNRQGIRWPRRLLGGVAGLILGGILAVVLSGPITTALDIREFEGEQAFFVVFILIPLFGLAGAVTGVLVSRPTRAGAVEVAESRRLLGEE